MTDFAAPVNAAIDGVGSMHAEIEALQRAHALYAQGFNDRMTSLIALAGGRPDAGQYINATQDSHLKAREIEEAAAPVIQATKPIHHAQVRRKPGGPIF